MSRKRPTSGEARRGPAASTPARVPDVSPTPPTTRATKLWPAVALALAVVGTAWWGAGALARRAQATRLPPLADLSALPAPARDLVLAADRAARGDARSARAVGALGQAYHASLMPTQAMTYYRLAEGLDPSAWEWTYYRGLLHEERGEQADALEAFARVTAANPAQGMAWFRIGEITFKQGALDRAEHAYQRAASAEPAAALTVPGVAARQLTPLAAYAQLGLARVALDRGLPQQALATLDALITAHPGFGPGRLFREQVAEAPPSSVGAGGARAYTPPSDPLVDAVVARSTMRDLLLKHAALAARGGDRAWREFLVRRAFELNPDDPNVLMEMAAMLQASGRCTEALDHLRRHERLVPGDHHTLVEQGRCLSDLGRYDEAEAVLRKAVRVRDAAAEYNLGSVLDRMGRSDEARVHYEQSLTIDPFHHRALNNLAVGLDRRGQSDAALEMFRRAIQIAPDYAEAYSNMGSAFIGLRRWPDAIRALETAIALAPEAPDAHNNLGIALAQSGRLPEAVREFETALRLNPRHVNARRNLDQVSRARR